MSDKIDPSTLELRAAPPYRLVRFRKSVVIAATTIGTGLILGLTAIALQKPHSHASNDAQELYAHADNQPKPDGLSALPSNYTQVPSGKPPELGPPLPGDLGRGILAHERATGISITAAPTEQRGDQQSVQARESGVFFHIDDKPKPNSPATAMPAASANMPSDSDGKKLALDPDRDQNNQQRKLDFINQRSSDSIYNPHALQAPASPYQVMAGSIIAASLITGVNSDLPGLVVAQVSENIYDTVTGQILLIPQGSRLIGSYDSVIAYGQSRALLVWQRIVMPDGTSVQIDNLPATDTSGYVGLEDEVDYHTWALLKGVALSTLLGVGTQIGFGPNESDLVRALRQSTQQNVSQAGQRITEKNLNIQPTITIRPGWPVRVIVYKDIVLKPYHGA